MKKILYIILVAAATMSSGCMKVLTKKVLTVTLPAKVEPFNDYLYAKGKDSTEKFVVEYHSILVFVEDKNTKKKVTKKEVVKIVAWSDYPFTPNTTIVIVPAKMEYKKVKKLARFGSHRKIRKFFKDVYIPLSDQKVSGAKK